MFDSEYDLKEFPPNITVILLQCLSCC